ncbi:MAG: NAD(P)-dependent oxidoreductase [Atribacterota bacterium]|nr:NAD(P)-dependent oxidoreductase [Atribacterota bacterium]
MKRIIITGANGIIGSELRRQFIDKGYHVIGIDRTEPKEKEKNSGSGQFKYVRLDITDQDKVGQFFSDLHFDYLIHCAALVHKNSPDLSFNNFMKINYEGTKNIFDSVVENKGNSGVGGAIFFSTIEVYGGEGRDGVISERDECRPITFYGKSKLSAEKYLLELNKESKLPIIILRLTPVYSEDFLRNVKRRVLIGENKFFYRVEDGEQRISLCSKNNVIDVVEACIKGGVPFGEVFNVADDKVYSFNDLLNYFRKLGRRNHITIKIPRFIVYFGIKLLSLVFPGRKEKLLSIYYKLTKDNIYSIEKAKKYFGYNPKWNFENTILKDRKILEDDKKSI